MKERFDPFVENMLRESGWFPGRNVENLVNTWKDQLIKDDSLYIFPKAEQVLLEFGGLKVFSKSPVEDVYDNYFRIFPLEGFEDDRYEEFSNYLGKQLYPLGDNNKRHDYLAISEDGKIYELMQNLLFLADNFDEAVTKMINGICAEFII